MTARQKILKWIYPLFIVFQKIRGRNRILHNKTGAGPAVSFYSLSAELSNGNVLRFEQLRGKKILLVNTASDCGYTRQYEELQKLYQHSREDLEIIAFPANDFKEQEKGSNLDIARFCVHQYGIRFPLSLKISVVKGPEQHPVFRWLTHKEENGWNDRQPSWNFSKYLVNEEGVLTHYFDPAVSPLSEAVIRAVHG